jgi:DNA-directed RNA polymerase specialized sigma24 family protein
MASDEALMPDFQRGSRAAFEELFARYREPLYGSRSEDLTQETLLAVLRAVVRYEPRATVRSYLSPKPKMSRYVSELGEERL